MRLSKWLPRLGSGLAADVRGRLPWYVDDWREAKTDSGALLRVLAAATYIFFASAIPALSFGQQLSGYTGGQLTAVQVLAATAASGVLQALAGGQPLLIVGVAEPIVLVYDYLYSFATSRDSIGSTLFLPWAAWVCVWTSGMMLLLAVTNAANYVNRFTRFAGEIFGLLITVLFFQQAIKGAVEEFSSPDDAASPWPLVNGLWSLFLAFGLCMSALTLRTARHWRFLSGPLRASLADYGSALMVVAWSGLSFAVGGQPGVPSRIDLPNTWDVTAGWNTGAAMGQVAVSDVFIALIPALLISLLFFFDHAVSAQLAQQPEFGLRKPPAYHYDFAMLGLMTLMCGLLGLPPVNGVLPQSPMHTRSLIRQQRPKHRDHHSTDRGDQAAAGDAAADGFPADGPAAEGKRRVCGLPAVDAAGGGTFGGQAEERAPPGTGPEAAAPAAAAAAASGGGLRSRTRPGTPRSSSAAAADSGAAPGAAPPPSAWPPAQPPRVVEQRVSGLVQSLAVGLCLAATPALQQIPTAVLWGYFAFMAIEGLAGSQLWDRTLLLLTDPKKRHRVLETSHAPYLETVPFRVVAGFTLLQLAWTGAVYGLTWAGIAGILFPLPIMALVPVRQYLLPRIMRPQYLAELDAQEDEEAALHGLAPAAAPNEPSSSDDEAEEETHGPQHLRAVRHVSQETLRRRRQSLEVELGGAAGGSAAVASQAAGQAAAARGASSPHYVSSPHARGLASTPSAARLLDAADGV